MPEKSRSPPRKLLVGFPELQWRYPRRITGPPVETCRGNPEVSWRLSWRNPGVSVETFLEKPQSPCEDFRRNFRRSLENFRRNPGSSRRLPWRSSRNFTGAVLWVPSESILEGKLSYQDSAWLVVHGPIGSGIYEAGSGTHPIYISDSKRVSRNIYSKLSH